MIKRTDNLNGLRMKTELIDTYMQQHNLKKADFCKLADLSLSVLYKVFRQDTHFKATTLSKICAVLGIKEYEFFE